MTSATFSRSHTSKRNPVPNCELESEAIPLPSRVPGIRLRACLNLGQHRTAAAWPWRNYLSGAQAGYVGAVSVPVRSVPSRWLPRPGPMSSNSPRALLCRWPPNAFSCAVHFVGRRGEAGSGGNSGTRHFSGHPSVSTQNVPRRRTGPAFRSAACNIVYR